MELTKEQMVDIILKQNETLAQLNYKIQEMVILNHNLLNHLKTEESENESRPSEEVANSEET